jgi:transcriptional regulator with XRE-family HTH domain
MTNFGTRLLAERKRLGVNQAEMADWGGIRANAQVTYEKDSKTATVDYLEGLAAHGVDINYLFYGEYANTMQTKQGTEMFSVIFQLPPTHQALAFSFLKLLQRSVGLTGKEVAQATAFWDAVQMFDQFLDMSTEGKALIKSAATTERLRSEAGKDKPNHHSTPD